KKRIYISITLLAFSVLSNSLRTGVYFMYYLLDSEGFIEEFCENKSQPELHCDGKCKLIDVSSSENQTSTDFDFKELKVDFNWIIQQTISYHFFNTEEQTTHIFHYKNPFWEKIHFNIFHPPV
ncbi:MAG: hypothetical protein Q4C98_11615, partial [Capnocytophaga sp.]|nr:hypothetical protein [Capnocytophaga sp.]